MGPRQSAPIDPNSAAQGGGGGRGVRTNATNSALVRNFDHLFGSHLAGDGSDQQLGSTPARSPQHTSLSAGGSSSDQLGVAQQQPPPAEPEPPQTTPFCLRYKFQLPKQHQQQPPANKNQPPLPPPPQQGVTVDLFDGDGRPVTSLPLNQSEGEFFGVVAVPIPPPGEKPLVQYFRFNVDGRPGVCHPHLPQQALPGGTGDAANFVMVSHSEVAADGEATKQGPAVGKDGAIVGGAPAAAEDDNGWSQQPPQFEETRKFPPIMPPHLRYTPLNAPPSQFRCDQDGNVVPVTDEGAAVGPEQRPAPLSVTINHVFFQKREDHVLAGMSVRWRDKSCTLAYYKHDLAAGAVPMAIPMNLPR